MSPGPTLGGARSKLRCGDIEIVTSDVLDYEIPGNVTVAFFNNRFGGEVFGHVIEGLLDSVDRHPLRLRVVYRNPVERDYLASTGRFALVRKTSGLRPNQEWSLEKSTGLCEVRPARNRCRGRRSPATARALAATSRRRSIVRILVAQSGPLLRGRVPDSVASARELAG